MICWICFNLTIKRPVWYEFNQMSWWLNYLMHFSIAFIVFEPLYGCWVVKCIVLILFHVDFFNSNHNILILHRIENYCSINVLNASTKWYVTQYDVCQFIVGSSKNWVFFLGGGAGGGRGSKNFARKVG